MSSVSSATYTTSTSSYSVNRSGLTTEEAVTLKVQPYLDRIDSISTLITENETKISAYETMQSLLQDLQTYAEYLQNPDDDDNDAFSYRTVSLTSSGSSDASTVVSAEIEDGTATGSHTIVVQQLATAQRLGSTVKSSTSSTLGLEGAFTLAEGSYAGATISVTASMSLSDVASAINAQSANTGVSASIITVSSSSSNPQYELVLTATDTGEAIEMNTLSGTALSDLGITGSDGSTAATVLQEANQAILTIDGVSGITRSSNDIDDILDGVTLHLTKADASSTITMAITSDTTSVENAISNFVDAYNSWRSFVSLNQTVDSSTGEASSDATLFGDSTLRSVANAVADALSTYFDSSSLTAIGITYDSSNYLEIDTATLQDALTNSFASVQKLFEYSGSSSNANLTLTDHGSSTFSGTLTLTITTDGSTITGATGTDSNGNTVSFTYSGNTLYGATGTVYEGLTLKYTGTDSSATMTMTTTQGIADKIWQITESYGDGDSGQVESIIQSLEDKDDTLTARQSSLQSQADSYATYLQTRYGLLEAKIAAANQTASLLQQLMASDDS
jgi:flagellar hook-associated protein 2